MKTTAPKHKYVLGEMVLYTPETSTGPMNGMREYVAFIGQIEMVGTERAYHLVVFAPFARPQWFANVLPFKAGEVRRGSFRQMPEGQDAPLAPLPD